MTAFRILVQAQDFDLGAEIDRMSGDGATGAVATFTGYCRDEDGRLDALELEHYPGMAEAQIEAVANAAADRFPLAALTIIHRHGRIRPGERIVAVLASSRHRDAAFDAARFVMDYLKTDAPFWKKEWLRGGAEGRWVPAKGEDDAARSRWTATRDET